MAYDCFDSNTVDSRLVDGGWRRIWLGPLPGWFCVDLHEFVSSPFFSLLNSHCQPVYLRFPRQRRNSMISGDSGPDPSGLTVSTRPGLRGSTVAGFFRI